MKNSRKRDKVEFITPEKKSGANFRDTTVNINNCKFDFNFSITINYLKFLQKPKII